MKAVRGSVSRPLSGTLLCTRAADLAWVSKLPSRVSEGSLRRVGLTALVEPSPSQKLFGDLRSGSPGPRSGKRAYSLTFWGPWRAGPRAERKSGPYMA